MEKQDNRYRPEIDGLRAVAIASVILYHAKLKISGIAWFNGGFIGVDIFFVISGYLITRIILSELKEKKSFKFLNFFERRARRILPVLFLVIFVTAFLFWGTVSELSIIELSKSALASIFFVSNFYFYSSAVEYGAESALLKPLLHTWSLSVEEQFYLVFPCVLVLFYRVAKQQLIHFFALVTLASFLFANYMVLEDPKLNFYLPISRVWEIIAGSMVAFYEINHTDRFKDRLKNRLSIIGLLLITLSLVFFNEKTPHPGIMSIFPVLGAALVINFSSQKNFVGRLLGIKPLVYLGLLSYSAYLWHYPIFALARHNALEHSLLDKFFWILLTGLASGLSYFIIEKPFRNKKVIPKPLLLLTIFAATSASLGFFTLVINGNLASKHNILDHKTFERESLEFEINYDYSLRKNEKENILIVGNSHAEDLLKILHFSDISNAYNVNLTSPPVRKVDINYQLHCFIKLLTDNKTECEKVEFGRHVIDQYQNAKIIFLASRWHNRPAEVKLIPEIISELLSDEKIVVVVSNTPHSPVYGEKRLNIFDRFVFESHDNELPSEAELKRLEQKHYQNYIKGEINTINNNLREITHNYHSDKVFFADRSDFMCNKNEKRCFLFFPTYNAKLLRDYGHITTDGAQILAEILDETNWLNNVFGSKL